MKRLIILLILPLNILFSQDFERIAPHKPLPSCPSHKKGRGSACEKVEKDNLLISSLKGVRLVSDICQIDKTKKMKMKGIVIKDLEMPCCSKGLVKYLSCFLNKPLTKQGLVNLKREIILFYRSHDRPIIHVFIPEQNVTEGGLQIVVSESLLGRIYASGNCHFSDNSYLCQMRSKPGCPVNTECLVEDLDWLNRNPFRQVSAVFIPSVEDGYTDIELASCDRRPVRFFAGVENTGLDITGHNRWFTGVNWGNVFGLGHIFSYQFTMGTKYDEFWAHSANYQAPLPCRHVLSFFGGYSEIESVKIVTGKAPEEGSDLLTETQLMKTNGESLQASCRYDIPLFCDRDLLQDVIIGFDYKRTNTNLTLMGELFSGGKVNLTQFMLGYNMGYESKYAKQALTFEVFFSPATWLPHQSKGAFESLRWGASGQYIYARAAYTPIYSLPKCFVFEPILRWQISSANLLASEQMGIGGYNSVRGYEERDVNVDNGIILNLNLKAPPIPLYSYFKRGPCTKDGLIFLLFFDAGYGYNHYIQSDEDKTYSLSSIGPGLRYFFGNNISARGDWGYQLDTLSWNNRSYMFHFGLTLSY